MFYDFVTKYTDIFVEKMREAFALQKLLTFFQQKYWHISNIYVRKVYVTLTNDVVSYKHQGPDTQNYSGVTLGTILQR